LHFFADIFLYLGKMAKRYKALVLFLTAALCGTLLLFHHHHGRLKRKIAQLQESTCWKSENHKRQTRDSRLLASRAQRILDYFIPKDGVGKNLMRMGRNYDGGYIMVDDFGKCEAAYSFGIADDVSWDLDVAKRGIDVFLYDHTIETLPIQDKRFHFFRTGICGTSGEGKNLKTLQEILTENGHIASKNLILKIDVEGAEWNAFEKTSSEIIDNFAQIAVEFHSVNKVDDKDKWDQMLHVFEKLNSTHQVVHVHANNFGSFDIIGGIPFPNTWEVTYLRRRGNEFTKSEKCYPVKNLDMPNNPEAADFLLGFCGLFKKQDKKQDTYE
jgi:hypothetical protein